MRAVCPCRKSPKQRQRRRKNFFGFVDGEIARSEFHSHCLATVAILLLAASCATPPRDTAHRVLISVPEQRMALLEGGKPIATYPVSTSKFGLGDYRGSWGTPLGRLEVATKIGGGAPLGAVFKDRHFTGEVIPVDAPGRDPIVTRILWLRGREPQNANAYRRYIYIHGTPEERNIGSPGKLRLCAHAIARCHSTLRHGRAWRRSHDRQYGPCMRSIRRFFRLAESREKMKEPFAGVIAR